MMSSVFAKTLTRRVVAASTITKPASTIVPVVRRDYSSTSPLRAQIPDSVIVLEYQYVPRYYERRAPYHRGHLYLAKEMIGLGKCIAGGPITPHTTSSYDGSSEGTEPTGAFFWFTSLDAVNEFLEKDPYFQADIVTGHKIYDWNVAVSR